MRQSLASRSAEPSKRRKQRLMMQGAAVKARDEREGRGNKVRIRAVTKSVPGSFSTLLASCCLKFLLSTPCHHATQN